MFGFHSLPPLTRLRTRPAQRRLHLQPALARLRPGLVLAGMRPGLVMGRAFFSGFLVEACFLGASGQVAFAL
ncbi:hypothetical protein ABZ297_30765 [Nonomuraea sp. NPDC005983]|uniref:hypothetical protein n=1 Tax=Nonomuraea sp. NPDC005983 TaxID=3155595 RepID=UPI0033B5F400